MERQMKITKINPTQKFVRIKNINNKNESKLVPIQDASYYNGLNNDASNATINGLIFGELIMEFIISKTKVGTKHPTMATMGTFLACMLPAFFASKKTKVEMTDFYNSSIDYTNEQNRI